VKCTNCLDVKMAEEHNSCPDGTKLFSPRTEHDWRTFFASTAPLRDPHFIIDVTKETHGCDEGCADHEMNSARIDKTEWKTSDGSPWWLRSTKYDDWRNDYMANCYLNLVHTPFDSADDIQFEDRGCGIHSKSYYCQPKQVSTTPKAGSPLGCTCKQVELTGRYTPGQIVKCEGCIDVHKTTQKNSCPVGTKIFAPATRQDWGTIISSVEPLRDPNWIVDISRPQNGCGGCTGYPMNSDTPAQATWRTSDGAPWWLQSVPHLEPREDYEANCYLNLHDPVSEDSIFFDSGTCQYHSKSYYCQTTKKQPKPVKSGL